METHTSRRLAKLRTMPYEEYLKTPEWKEKRELALKRDEYQCRACNSSEKLHVHHRTYERRGNEDLNDLTTLCESCHEHFHRKMSQMEIMLKTYIEPTSEDIAERKKKQHQNREDYLIGLLIQNPSLYPYVCGILSESDFFGTDTPALYQLLGSVSSDMPFEQFAPSDLRHAVSRAVEVFSADPLPEDRQVKAVIQLAARIKWNRLAQSGEELQALVREATDAEDIVTERQLRKQIFENRKLMYALSAVKG